MSFDDIWEADLVEPPITRTQTTSTETSRQRRRQLFYSDSEDEVNDAPRNRDSAEPVSPTLQNSNKEKDGSNRIDKDQLDAMFAELDDEQDIFGDIGEAVDVEKLKRQAAAKITATKGAVKQTTTATLDPLAASSSPPKKGKDGVKVKRVMPKLDEERLLGKDGFPRLVKEYKSFKVTGKGHEAADLDRLFRLYHGWAHKLYPKFKLSDTVERVEKLCRSRRMTANLRVWRDEVNGTTSGVRHEVTRGSGDEDSDGMQGDADESGGHGRARQGSAGASTSRPSTPVTRPASAASTAPSVPSSATDVEDMDIDALLREEEELLRAMDGEQSRSTYKPAAVEEDDEEALWAGFPDPPMEKTRVLENNGYKPSHTEANDEDMWDIIAEMEAASNRIEPVNNVKENKVAAEPTIGADWDDMYE
ncbi:replication fork protection component Swi3-domain-containing protein [Hysterangium stoloniferum]|nr:replication fork protection component Swi3-domain-containing protein [Hysterangium stoloniferum]